MNPDLGTPPKLVKGTVHVWRSALSRSSREDVAEARLLLSPDELERADRFQFCEGRDSFTLRRSFLRRVLSRYTGLSPGALEFAYGEMGKPELLGGHAVKFNQSDSGDWTVVAVSLKAVGVDIEVVRPRVDIETVAQEVFTEREREELARVPETLRLTAFYNGWTRKEAVIKALGSGLAYPLQDIDVSLAPGVAPTLNRLGTCSTPGWSIAVFQLEGGVVGGVAAAEDRMVLLHLPPID